MPIHDWTRVEPGVFYSFRVSWLTRISDALNNGWLPPGYYALTERDSDDPERGRTRTVGVWSADKVRVAVVELVSAADAVGAEARRAFVRRLVGQLERGIHLLVIDLFPPDRWRPRGVHDAVWGELTGHTFEPPADAPLTLVSYEAGDPSNAYLDPTAVGLPLPDMPLFLAPERYVTVPLEATYAIAWDYFPPVIRDELDPPAAG